MRGVVCSWRAASESDCPRLRIRASTANTRRLARLWDFFFDFFVIATSLGVLSQAFDDRVACEDDVGGFTRTK